jgi:hypothetical protein
MFKVLGYLLVGIGLLGVVYITNYKGSYIELKGLWLVLSLGPILLGSYFLTRQGLKTSFATQEHSLAPNLHHLKETGHRVKLSLENCEVKTRSFQVESFKEDSSIAGLDALYDQNRNYQLKEVTKTYLVYKRKHDGQLQTFVSPPISQDAVSIKMYLDEKGINLYIDNANHELYYFDLP